MCSCRWADVTMQNGAGPASLVITRCDKSV
jgi:hypothetical protein